MRDRLLPTGMCSGHVTFCQFLEIGDNITEMLQDRDILGMEEY